MGYQEGGTSASMGILFRGTVRGSTSPERERTLLEGNSHKGKFFDGKSAGKGFSAKCVGDVYGETKQGEIFCIPFSSPIVIIDLTDGLLTWLIYQVGLS